MSGFDALWGDELTEDDVAECMELETQASQVPVPTSVHPQPSGSRNYNFLLEDRGVTNAPQPTGNALSHIPPFTSHMFRDDQVFRSTSNSSSSSSSSPALSLAQRKLKAPVRSLPDMPLSQSKDKIQAATTDWLRKELEKHKKQEIELKQSRQTLEGEVRLLRERNNAYQQQLIKMREHSDQEIKLLEEKFLTQLKDLKKEAENAKMQLVMKSKESEANKERYLELKNVSVLEPEFHRTQTPVRDRCRNLPKTPRSAIRCDNIAADVDDDNEEDYFSQSVVIKRPRREAQSDLKTFSCDELIRVMDGPAVTSPVKRPRDKPVEIDLTESPAPGSDSTPVKFFAERETVVRERRVEVVESKITDLGSKFPWLKDKNFSLTVHLGQILSKEISEKIYTLADPEIKIIVPPCIDFDPGSVLKMDCSDLKYLEDLEKGEKIWGVDLKTMYDTSKPTTEEPQAPEDDDPETLETVKTILGSQMCGQSPDQSRLSESSIETHSPTNQLPTISNMSKTANHEDSILLWNLEPIHVHLRALTKLAKWDSAMDLISSIVHHLTLMINELHERLCDPRIPDQLKDQFYNNEFAVGKLFMKGPYHSNDLLAHQKWMERERYVELRRGLAVLSLLCSLNRDTAILVLDHELLDDVLKSNKTTMPSSYRSYNQDSFMATSLRKQCQRKIMCKVDETTLRFSELLKEEDSKVQRQTGQLTDSISGSGLSISSPSTSTASNTVSSVKQNLNICTNITDNEVMSLLMSKEVDDVTKSAEDEEQQSIGSNPSTVNADEIMDIEDDVVEGDVSSSEPRSLDEIDHDSFKAWFETYTQNRVSFTVEDSQTSGSKTHKYSKLLDPQLAENERKELSVYLKRRKFCKEFYKSVVEKGSVWEPTQDKNDEGGFSSDMDSVRNLYDYENKISTMNSTITSDELASMRPGTFCPENKDVTIDTDITVRTQEDNLEDNEWRVNSLQKNEEDPSLTKVEKPAKEKNEKNWSFFEKFQSNNAETSKGLSNADSLANFSGPDSRFKQVTSKTRKHSLAPLKKKGGRDASPTGSLTDINKEMEMEVEMLFGKTTGGKKFDKQKRHHQDINDMSPFAPELRFPEALSDDDQKSDTLTELVSRLPTMEDPEFEQRFKSLYNQAETISSRLGHKLKPFKSLVTCAYLDKQKKNLAEEAKKKNQGPREPKKSLTSDKEAGILGGSIRNQDESDPIITMLNEEALKYSLKKNIKSFEKKKGNLHLLDGIYEIVSAINYSRLTLVFYPLLSSCVSLIESLFKQSFNNEYFSKELFVLIMKILNEVTCCQPPPDIIEKILGVLMYAVNYPDILECLCKKRSNLVSLVTKTEFCFFKGVCMMQPLCYLVGVLSSTSYPGYWTLSLAFTRWLRQLYDRYRIYLEPWYPPNQVCNCVPVLHSALFTTLAKASAFLANHASDSDLEEGVRLIVESIVRDGIRLCEVLIDMDTGFVNHLDKFHLYNEFLATVKEIHYDPFFSPLFQLDSHQLKVVECLISANELLASKSKGSADKSRTEPLSLELTKLNFSRVFDQNNIFLTCSDKYDRLC